MSSGSSLPLNPNQRRKLAVSLALLGEDLERLLRSPELAESDREGQPLRQAINRALVAAERVRERLGLSVEGRVSFRRTVVATAEVWLARLEELKAHNLRRYGSLPASKVAASLDPLIVELQQALVAVASAAGATVIGKDGE